MNTTQLFAPSFLYWLFSTWYGSMTFCSVNEVDSFFSPLCRRMDLQSPFPSCQFFISVCVEDNSQKVKVKSESEVAQSCPILCYPMDCSLPGSSVHGIFQARVLEWVAISFSRRSSWLRDGTQVSLIVGRHFTVWVTREVLYTLYPQC